jgi:hypothetical protein
LETPSRNGGPLRLNLRSDHASRVGMEILQALVCHDLPSRTENDDTKATFSMLDDPVKQIGK